MTDLKRETSNSDLSPLDMGLDYKGYGVKGCKYWMYT